MKAFANKPFVRTLTASAVAALLALPVGAGYAAGAKQDASTKPAAPAQMQVTDREAITQYAGWEDPDLARIAVHGGRALLRHVQAAHTALEENKVGEARASLTAAEDFAEGLQLMAPYTVVADHIRDAKKELLASDSDVVVNDMLPIYASVDEMADYAPDLATKAKGKLDEAVKHMKAADKAKAAEKLDEVAADISSTTVYLPVLYVEHQIEAARHALDKDPPDAKLAKTAVDNAMDSLVHATVTMFAFPNEKATGKTASVPASAAAPTAPRPSK
jgi:tetrahydromethanopterin S-methyltransferase subunit B